VHNAVAARVLRDVLRKRHGARGEYTGALFSLIKADIAKWSKTYVLTHQGRLMTRARIAPDFAA